MSDMRDATPLHPTITMLAEQLVQTRVCYGFIRTHMAIHIAQDAEAFLDSGRGDVYWFETGGVAGEITRRDDGAFDLTMRQDDG